MPLRNLLLFLAMLLPSAFADTGTSVDCTPGVFTFTSATTGAAITNSNSATPCVAWRVTYNTTGFSGISIQIETSPDNSSWTIVTNSVCSPTIQPPCVIDGANPSTTTGNGTFAVRAYGRYVRLNVTVATGTGTINARVFGYKGLSASAGGGSGGGGGGAAAALVLLEEHTAATSATLNFTTAISATYDTYEIQFVNLVPDTTAVSFQMRMSTDGGATYLAGTNYTYGLLYSGVSDVPTQASGSGVAALDLAHSVSTTANYSVNGTIWLYAPSGGSFKFINGKTQAVASGNLYQWGDSGVLLSTTAVNAFQFFFSSGNITSGNIRVYGITK